MISCGSECLRRRRFVDAPSMNCAYMASIRAVTRLYPRGALTTRCTERGFARSVRARFNLVGRFAFIVTCQPRL